MLPDDLNVDQFHRHASTCTLIGLERERRKGEGPTGIRIFTLPSLLGTITIHLEGATRLALSLDGLSASRLPRPSRRRMAVILVVAASSWG